MENIYTTRQVAEKLGVNVITIYGYIYAGSLKAHKLGGYSKRRHWRVRESDLEAFINNGQDARHHTPSAENKNSSENKSGQVVA